MKVDRGLRDIRSLVTAGICCLALAGHGQIVPMPVHASTFDVRASITPKKIPAGQPVPMLVMLKNITDTPQTFPEMQVYVEGISAEAPMTLRQRQLTGRTLPGEEQLMGGGAREVLQPGVSSPVTFQLLTLYDLSKPGVYTVYVEIEDEGERHATGKVFMVRSPVATFEIKAVGKK